MGLFISLILYADEASKEPVEPLNAIGVIIFIMILGGFIGAMVGLMCIISISVQEQADTQGMKISIPIISTCAIFFMMIGGVLGILARSGQGFSFGMLGGIFIGVIIGTAINALYYHQDVWKDVSELIKDLLHE